MAYRHVAKIENIAQKYPQLINVVHCLAEFQKAQEDAGGIKHCVVPRDAIFGDLKSWTQFKTFFKVWYMLVAAGITNYYEYFTAVIKWWKSNGKGGHLPIGVCREWTLDLYQQQVVDSAGAVRERGPMLEERIDIENSVSLLKGQLDRGLDYRNGLVYVLTALSPYFLATDKTYLSLVMDGILELHPEVATLWDRMNKDSKYHRELVLLRNKALEKLED